MALIQVRDVDESDLRILKLRAADAGQSLNSYMRELVHRDASSPTVDEVLRRAAARTRRDGRSVVEVMDEARAERDRELEPGARSEPSHP